MNRLLILILTLFISDYAFAQISTDRPDQTESSLVLPKGTIQIESGFVSRKNEYFQIHYLELEYLKNLNLELTQTIYLKIMKMKIKFPIFLI